MSSLAETMGQALISKFLPPSQVPLGSPQHSHLLSLTILLSGSRTLSNLGNKNSEYPTLHLVTAVWQQPKTDSKSPTFNHLFSVY